MYYYKCGGCQLQHMTYQAQLDMKKEQVVNLFIERDLSKIHAINPTVGMEQPWRYRNKSQIPVGKNKDGQVIMDSIVKEVMTLSIWIIA